MDESAEQRINQIRMREAMQTEADIIGLSCPFCLQMMDEAINDLGSSVEAMDLSEIIARSQFHDRHRPYGLGRGRKNPGLAGARF